MSFSSGICLNHGLTYEMQSPSPHTQHNYPLLVTNCQSTCQRQTMQWGLCKSKQHKMLIVSIREPLSTGPVGGRYWAPQPRYPRANSSANCRRVAPGLGLTSALGAGEVMMLGDLWHNLFKYKPSDFMGQSNKWGGVCQTLHSTRRFYWC